jgi:hypothetical protein
MSDDKATKIWRKQSMDRVLGLLPTLEDPNFKVGEWHGGDTRVEDGQKVMSMPFIAYHPAIKKLWKILYDSSAYIDAYAQLPEDIIPMGEEFCPQTIHLTPRYFETATLNQVRRYLVLITRGERLCEGYIAQQHESGALVVALRRLRSLRIEAFGAVP